MHDNLVIVSLYKPSVFATFIHHSLCFLCVSVSLTWNSLILNGFPNSMKFKYYFLSETCPRILDEEDRPGSECLQWLSISLPFT